MMHIKVGETKLWLVMGQCTGMFDGVDLGVATFLLAHKPTQEEAEKMCAAEGTDPDDEKWDVEIREMTVEAQVKKWEAHVWRFTFMGKSRSGNWYEGKFRWYWMAYLAARFWALMCDWVTPKHVYVEYDVRGSEEKYIERQDSPYGIAWGVKPVDRN